MVTVFEKDDRLGGLLVYGIPDFKLDKIHVQRRIDQMTQEGVEFKTGIEIGKDLKISDLRKQFDALLIAIGAQHARKLEKLEKLVKLTKTSKNLINRYRILVQNLVNR